jgi:hypothetical protein
MGYNAIERASRTSSAFVPCMLASLWFTYRDICSADDVVIKNKVKNVTKQKTVLTGSFPVTCRGKFPNSFVLKNTSANVPKYKIYFLIVLHEKLN